jgi:hypothetical protein
VDIQVFVHPIDAQAHPSSPGWRWAVHVHGGAPSDLLCCANAGWTPDRDGALSEGDRHGATAARVLRMHGIEANYHVPTELDYDPIPAGNDRVNVL